MIIHVLHCPTCQGTNIVFHGKTRQGKQRYRCREKRCAARTFLLDYTYPGQAPELKQQIVDIALNASGIRDTARVARQHQHGHEGTQKKAPELHQVNQAVLADRSSKAPFPPRAAASPQPPARRPRAARP